MAKAAAAYSCAECGARSMKWTGRCDTCGEWNTLVEDEAPAVASGMGASARRVGGVAALGTGGRLGTVAALKDVTGTASARWLTGLRELDFVLGGGLVPGSMVLVGGDPGIGKSTLVLQAAGSLQQSGRQTIYVSGEESASQVKLRADRIGGHASDVLLMAETQLETILATVASQSPAVLMIDSIQTVFTSDLDGAPGSVGQVRESASRLMRFAKETGTAVIVIGHVTKEGGIAGPKTLEHIVDTVLYFEGERSVDHRVLRATKNRFGSVDEIGVFRMTDRGLEPVANASALFMGDRAANASGSALCALVEGTRPLILEIQGLAAKAGYGTPQRVATGYDGRRLALLLAVLDKRAGLPFPQLDVFLNVVGGLRLTEPAGDLAVAAALASSVHDRVLPADSVFIGEIGLGGEIRAVSQIERRVAEAANMGLSRVFVGSRGAPPHPPSGMIIERVETLTDLFRLIFS